MFRWKRSPNPKADLEELIGGYELPSFPAAAVSTLGLLRQDCEDSMIADRIVTDPGLSVRILRTVNSAAFGLRQRATNVGYAVTLLGRARVESLVLSAAVAESIPPQNGIDLTSFWQTCSHRACLARLLAEEVDPDRTMEAFTAGLLQDMAIPVMATAHPDRYPDLFRRTTRDPEGDLAAAEQSEFGYDHAQVGAMMAECWSLPEELITAIADHHLKGERAPAPVEAVAMVRHLDPPDDLEDLRAHCAERLGLEDDEVTRITAAAASEYLSLAESMTPGGAH